MIRRMTRGRATARSGSAASGRFPGWRTLLVLAFLWMLGSMVPTRAADTNRARVHLSGFGVLANLELKKQIRLLQRDKKLPVAFSGDQIEDFVLLIFAKVEDEGYLDARVNAELTLTDGTMQAYVWTNRLEAMLPRPLAVKKVALRGQLGRRSFYEGLEITGLRAIPVKTAREYFLSTEALLYLKSMRVFTPSQLNKSMDNLREALSQRGYENAAVAASRVERDPSSAAVRVEVTVREGLPSFVRSVDLHVAAPDRTETVAKAPIPPRTPFSRLWRQDFLQGLRTNQYARGYPDATAQLSVLGRQTNDTSIQVDLLATVTPGTHIRLCAVKFEGQLRTRPSVLEHFVPLESGEPLNRLRAEHARERLARLGVFDTVGLRYDRVDENTRDLAYELKERKSFDVNLLFGYGAYDRLGGGFEINQRNVLGLAHRQDLKATQTFKSSAVDYRYTLPEIFGENADLFLTGSLLRREEISFVREEYGGAIGAHRYFPALKTDASLRFDYAFLNAHAAPFQVVEDIGVGNARASAIVLELRHARLDNLLAPRRGYQLFANAEWASSALSGDVNYQRLQVGASKHWDLGGGRLIHLGATHGMSFVLGGTARELPFNKRFFPGGENSERGYTYGEAAPRDANGQIVGAECFLQGNAEFEQILTRTLSLVVFTDVVGFARRRQDYPLNQTLYAVGGGLRWKTVIGPVRLEYGHNLNPRPQDPDGTIQFSVGFPF